MASRERHTLSRPWSSALARIWRTVGGSLPSSVSLERLDGRAPPSPSAAISLSGEFSPAAPTTQSFGAHRPVYDRNAHPLRQCEGFRLYRPNSKLSRTALNEEELPVGNSIRASTNVAQQACHDSPSEAIATLKHRRQQGLCIDSYMFVDILKRCSRDLTATRQVHEYIILSGMQKHRYVATTLLNAYIKCGRLQDAHRVFDGLERANRNVITWNTLIGAYAKSGCGMDAYRLFHQMTREGFIPDAYTYSSILNASASAGALEWVKEVHSHACKAGLESYLRVGNALVHMYAKSGSVDDARLVFDRMETRDVITWNTMIGAYAEKGSIDDARLIFDRMEQRDVITWTILIGAYAQKGRRMEAYRLFVQMEREGFVPDALTYVSILNAAPSAGALEWVKEVHSHALKAGLESDVRVGNALVHMYARSGSINKARLVFDRMEKRDVFTWNVMIGGLAQHGRGHEALKLFERMNADCVKPDGHTLVAVLSACSHAGLVNDARRLFLGMNQDYGIEASVMHYNCMVDALGRAGKLEEAKRLIDNMPMEPNAVTWKALLGACRTHCDVELGELAAQEVFALDPKDSGAYVLLSNIYAATGRWEKMVSVRNVMQKRGVRKEPGRSWIAVDDKIHEFVVGDTSHPEATAIYSLLQELTEKLKAKGYVPDTRLVLHNINDEDKELALCSHSEKLAIAYGLLRVPRGESIRVEKNLRICSDCHAATKLISEVTGREIIAKDANRFHHFKDGVCSCGDYW